MLLFLYNKLWRQYWHTSILWFWRLVMKEIPAETTLVFNICSQDYESSTQSSFYSASAPVERYSTICVCRYRKIARYRKFWMNKLNIVYEPHIQQVSSQLNTLEIRGQHVFSFCKNVHLTHSVGLWQSNTLQTLYLELFLLSVNHCILIQALCRILVDCTVITDRLIWNSRFCWYYTLKVRIYGMQYLFPHPVLHLPALICYMLRSWEKCQVWSAWDRLLWNMMCHKDTVIATNGKLTGD